MDTSALVEGGAAGLERIVEALESEGVDVIGAYLIQITSSEGAEEFSLRIVTDDPAHEVLYKYVDLRRSGVLPAIANEVVFTPAHPNDVEASRVLDYAGQFDRPPVALRGIGWKGLYIQDAVVVKYPQEQRAVA